MTSLCGKYSPHHRLGGHNKDRKGTEDNDFALQGLNFSAFSCHSTMVAFVIHSSKCVSPCDTYPKNLLPRCT